MRTSNQRPDHAVENAIRLLEQDDPYDGARLKACTYGFITGHKTERSEGLWRAVRDEFLNWLLTAA